MFSENIRFLRRKYNMGQNQLADELGYKSFTTVQKWEDGTSVPPYRILARIADYFGVTVENLMSDDFITKATSLPVLGYVRGGTPIFAEQNILEYEPIEIAIDHVDEYFCLDVVGDSMKNARIMPGDRLYIHKQDMVENRQIGVVLIGEEATVKRIIFEKDKLILQPENDAYEPIVLTKEDQEEKGVKILGKVVYNKIRY